MKIRVKRGGAYSWGGYDTMPYVLLNYNYELMMYQHLLMKWVTQFILIIQEKSNLIIMQVIRYSVQKLHQQLMNAY